MGILPVRPARLMSARPQWLVAQWIATAVNYVNRVAPCAAMVGWFHFVLYCSLAPKAPEQRFPTNSCRFICCPAG